MESDHQGHNHHGTADEGSTKEPKRAYWRRAHHDWRFWVMMILVTFAMLFYIMTDNFASIYRGR